MRSLEERQASRARARSDVDVQDRKTAAILNYTIKGDDSGLKNPGIAIPKPEAATDTPALRAKADKELLESIQSGEKVVITYAEYDQLKKQVKDLTAKAKAQTEAQKASAKAVVKAEDKPDAAPASKPVPGWTPNSPQE